MVKSGGVILNISSEVAQKGFANRAAYSASKASIVGLTKAMAIDHAEHGIRVNVLCPGTVETPMVSNLIKEKVIKRDKSLSKESLQIILVSLRILPMQPYLFVQLKRDT